MVFYDRCFEIERALKEIRKYGIRFTFSKRELNRKHSCYFKGVGCSKLPLFSLINYFYVQSELLRRSGNDTLETLMAALYLALDPDHHTGKLGLF